ncbi:GT4 family glycosyltransferase PelF [Caloranaerobacter ferrireducens]|uniref:GT4 family glycosyltransferase PelF n=1 Tax=Caloranaerobacter ferrireducens TaxID=1323370 RepID=UPI00084D8076|nr:GT4 family glycosyltransferase PelF [Caloranaerobacter ferrireducens]
MEVCIISEGSYPYIPGGVASWIHQLVTEMKEINFKILSIMPSEDETLKYRYDVPENVIEIKTVYLNGYHNISPKKRKREPHINKDKLKELEEFLRFNKDVNWETVIGIMANRKKMGDCVEFLKSQTFWNILLNLYQEKYRHEDFNRFFWTMRSMFLPMINIIQTEIPKADIYHSVSTGYAGLLGVVSKVKYKKPFILTEHGIYAREREEEIIKSKWVQGIYKSIWINFFYFISTGAYKAADRVISLFERNRNIQLELGSEKHKTIVIPNGVDIKRYKVKKEKHEGFNIGAILRIVPIKDVKTLIRAFKIVNLKIPNSKLYLIGPYDEDKEYYNECLNLIKTLKLNKNVIITGRVDIKNYLPKMDVLVLTSISEGQPLVILEGMASGIPIVATDVGSCRELIEGTKKDDIGLAGIVTKPVSPNETADAVIRILKNEKLRQQMSLNGRKRVERYYTKEKLISRYSEIYYELR